MLRSLYAGVSGMKSFQTKMDVIANNIANVNTTAFKSGRVNFQDMLSQTMASAQGADANGLGGVNPQQVGLGVNVGSIDTIMTGGALQSTNRELDFAIEGEGFFVVSSDALGNTKSYTRDGAFYTDEEGNLTNSSGMRVLGYVPVGDYQTTDLPSNLDVPVDTNTEQQNLALLQPLKIERYIDTDGDGNADAELQSFSISKSGEIIGVYDDGNPYLLGQVGMVTFNNTAGLEKEGNNTYAMTENSGYPVAGIASEAGYGVIRQNFLEMSNVDLASEFTDMIVTSRAYQANSRSITTSDEMLQELINLKR